MTLPRTTAASLQEGAATLAATPSLLGFDGFIDTIYHAVDTRQSAEEYTRIDTLTALGQRISAAAGKSTNLEIVPRHVKLGGNGPIMANAMAALGVPLTYCGMTGFPTTNEVFRELGERAHLLPLADPALTDAFEFNDGKLIIGKHATVAEVSWDAIQSRVGADQWRQAWHQARFIAMVNWTMLPHMTELWRRLLEADELLPGQPRKTLFFDLADPAKRTNPDLLEALRTLARFASRHDVMLGLNEPEAVHVAQVLHVHVTLTEGLMEGAADRAVTADLAAGIRDALGIAVCVVHPTRFASGADGVDVATVDGAFTPHPKISTGAGDHFNAGFCCGRLMGLDLKQSLQCGVGTSGYYVRHAASPTLEQLRGFLMEL